MIDRPIGSFVRFVDWGLGVWLYEYVYVYVFGHVCACVWLRVSVT